MCLSLDWKFYFDLDFALKSFRCTKEMFETCSADNITKWIYKIVVGKNLVMKLWKIDKEDMENELACDSND